MYSFRMSFWIVPEIAAGLHALLLRDQLIQQQQQGGRCVDGHRRRYLIEPDAVEEEPHVLERVDGDADLAYLAASLLGVGVESHLRRQIEGHREPGRARCDELVIPAVGVRGGGETRVLTHRPRPRQVHGRVDAPGERKRTRLAQVGRRIETRDILGSVDVLDRRARLRNATHVASLRRARAGHSCEVRHLPPAADGDRRQRRVGGNLARANAVRDISRIQVANSA